MIKFIPWCVSNGLPIDATSFKTWRRNKLQESDWMDLPTTPAATTEWANYRRSLRDLPANAAYPLGLINSKFIPLDPNGE